MRVVDAARPLAERCRAGILERAGTGRDRNDLRTEQAHAVHIERLTLGVLDAHEYDALHAHQRSGGRGRNAVLTGAGLRDETGLAHLLSQKRLTEHVVDLVSAGVVEILALEVDLRAAEIVCHMLREIQARGTAGIVVQQLGQLRIEFRVVLIVVVGLFQFDDCVHQRLRHILTAVYAKTSLAHWCAPFTSAATWRILSMSLVSSVSIPLERSSAYAPVCAARVDIFFVKPSCEEIRVAGLPDQPPVKGLSAAAVSMLYIGIEQQIVDRQPVRLLNVAMRSRRAPHK